ncbi:MAG: hypothetical protein MJZ56_01920 [Bacteroidales bacterium]|nr:hypothetical protein [Bacteroidales bacterium]
MKISAISNISFNGDKKISQKAKAATVATLLMITPAGYATENDTFEKNENSVKTELVINPQSVSQTKITQSEGNKFCKWFWDMIDCINDNDKFDTNIMNEKGYNYYYPEVTDYDKLAESIVKSMDKNGDNEIDKKEFIDKSIEILEQQGQDYSYEEEQNMKNIVLAPLFCSLDYIGSAKDRINGTNTLNKEEIAGNLYALSKRNLKNGRFSGSAVAEEFLNIMYNYEPTGQFESERASYLNSTNNF